MTLNLDRIVAVEGWVPWSCPCCGFAVKNARFRPDTLITCPDCRHQTRSDPPLKRIPVPVLDFERHMDLDGIRPFDLDELKNPCKTKCLYGTCNLSMGDPYGCGGCCGCLGGCQVEYENAETAPHLWEGDFA